MSEPPLKLEYQRRESKAKRDSFVYVKRTVFAVFFIMCAAVAIVLLYVIARIVSLGFGGSI
jgi:hypothetical protein